MPGPALRTMGQVAKKLYPLVVRGGKTVKRAFDSVSAGGGARIIKRPTRVQVTRLPQKALPPPRTPRPTGRGPRADRGFRPRTERGPRGGPTTGTKGTGGTNAGQTTGSAPTPDPKGFFGGRIGKGLTAVGTGLAVNQAVESFTGDESLLDLVTGGLQGTSLEERRAAKRTRARQQAEEAALVARGELLAAQQGIDPRSLSVDALKLVAQGVSADEDDNRDAATRLFGTETEQAAVLSQLIGPNAISPIEAGLTLQGAVAGLQREIPMFQLLNSGERARLAEASRSTGPQMVNTGSREQVLRELRRATAAGAQGF